MFEWRPVERATSYELIVLGAGQREAALTLTLDASACDAASCALAAPVELAPGTYRWSVEARNRFGGSGRVVPLDFRIGPNPPVIVEGGMRIEATDGEARRLAARVAYPQWGLRCEWQFDPARVSVTETTSMPRTGGSAEVEARLLPGVESQEVVCRCTDWWGASGRATFTLTRD